MKFGAVPIEEAFGAILAHSVPLSKGRIRKGQVLSTEDINALKDVGRTEVVVAQLEVGDVEENEAAHRIAEAIVPMGAGLRVTRAATGRVNILAEGAGIAAIDVAAIEAMNAINPMITIATVPLYARMIERGMVATVKIIAYSVPEADVDAACRVARGALALRAPVFDTASFIQTSLEANITGKGAQATRSRLAALGVSMTEEAIVPHTIPDLSAAIKAAAGEVILILTASATSDIRDTAPAALVMAGGEIASFGMPVDPGNLLFLGSLEGKPVIGLPGCARSPALNGVDWVLERVLCRVKVTQQDISGMGVGGLLKEIASRPQPRALKI